MKEEQFWEIVEKPLPKRPLQMADPRNNACNLAHAPCSHVQSVQGAPTAPPLSHSPSLLFHPISAPSDPTSSSSSAALVLFRPCRLLITFFIVMHAAAASIIILGGEEGGTEGERGRSGVPHSPLFKVLSHRGHTRRPTGADRASFQTVLGLIDVGRGREMDIEASGPAGLHSLPCQIAHLYSLKQ